MHLSLGSSFICFKQRASRGGVIVVGESKSKTLRVFWKINFDICVVRRRAAHRPQIEDESLIRSFSVHRAMIFLSSNILLCIKSSLLLI